MPTPGSQEDPYADQEIPPPDDPAETGKGKGPSPAKLLVEMAQEQYRMVRSTDARTYAVAKDGPARAIPLGSKKGLKYRLSTSLYRQTGIVAGSSALSDCLTILEGEAADLTPEPVYLRMGRTEQREIVVDLGTNTGHVAVITPGGWSVQGDSPALFRRSDLSSPFLPPVPGGALDDLRTLLNLTERDYRLAIGWVIAAYFCEIPHPILFVQGEQGTGKTDLVRALLGLIDPPDAAAEREIPADKREWAIFGRASWAFMYDNITSIPQWFSDALCKGSTGNASLQRELQSDEDIMTFSFLRVIAITYIELQHEIADDLADRMLLLEPEVIEERLAAEEVAARRKAALPGALAAVFDLVAKVLTHLPTVTVKHPTRMADFMYILAALDAATGWSTLADYRDKVAAVGVRLIEGDGFARALYYLAGSTPSDTPAWEGTAGDLVGKLRQIAEGKNLPAKDIPTEVRAVGKRLQQIAPSLRKAGVDIRKRERTNSARGYQIYKRAAAPHEPSPLPSSEEE